MQDRSTPELYRKYIFPRHKRLYDFIHSGPGQAVHAFLRLHPQLVPT